MVRALLVALLSSQQPDTATFRDAATAQLYALARVRHVRQDSMVHDYQAVVRTRLEASYGRSRFARLTTLIAHETVAKITWRRPNDLKVEVLGARGRAPIVRMLGAIGDVGEDIDEDLRSQLVMDRPWFIPRALGDSIRVMGVPDQAVLHPLASRATDHYRFAIVDSVTIVMPDRRVQAITMHVEPKRYGPALMAGDMWLDTKTGDVVRIRMLFLGEYLWDQPEGDTPEDSAEARHDNEVAQRFLSVEAEIEYALIDQRYWMPYRQFLAITAEIPFFLNATIPARALTTFGEYVVNTDAPISFAIPDEELGKVGGKSRRRLRVMEDSMRDVGFGTDRMRREHGYDHSGRWRDGRWEVAVPPADTLASYQWEEEFQLNFDPVEEERLRRAVTALAELENELPASWTGKRRFGLAWEQFADIVRFNRVQGVSLGAGLKFKPKISFTTIFASARFGLADLRPTGSVMWRRDGPGGRLDVSAYRSVLEAEPWTRGLGVGNSINALFTAHDDADYYLALGGGLAFTWNTGWTQDMTLGVAVERHDSMVVESRSAIGSGDFQPNPAVHVGTFLRASASRDDRLGESRIRTGVMLLTDDSLTGGRVWASVDLPFQLLGRTGRIVARAGAMRGDNMPQLLFRVGGSQTVRGYTYGTRRGREMWSLQLDYALRRSGLWAPVVFADVGDTFDGNPLIGVGAGISLLNGFIRFNLAKGVNPTTDVRLDLLFRAPR